jgi:hypothetical protein
MDETVEQKLIQFIFLKEHCEIKRKYLNQKLNSEL